MPHLQYPYIICELHVATKEGMGAYIKGALEVINDLWHPVSLAVLASGGVLLRCARYDIGQRARQALLEVRPHAVRAALRGGQLLLKRALSSRHISAADSRAQDLLVSRREQMLAAS